MILLVLKTCLFLFSFLGLNLCISKQFKLRLEFTPIVTVCLISIGVFIAGLLNALYITSILIYISGIAYAGMYLIRNQKPAIPMNFLIIAAVVFLLLIMLRGAQLMHYDNFSHWGLIVEDMLRLNSFPTELNDSLVTFITYPPGSATFLYYVCRFVGTSEGVMTFGQSLITFFSILPLLALMKRKKAIGYAAFTVIVLITFTINVQIHDLLVDTLLSSVGAAVTIMLYVYRRNIMKALPAIVPLLIFLCLLKNSGIYFIIGNLALYLYYAIKSKQMRFKDSVAVIICFSLPFIMMYFWKTHINLCYSSELIEGAKHSLSFKAYLHNLDLLGTKAIRNISQHFLNALTGYSYPIILYFYCIDAVCILITVFIAPRYRNVMIALNILGIIYFLFLWAMYLFSMPYDEAIELASFERYTITFILYYIIVMFMIFFIEEKMRVMQLGVGIISIITLCFICNVRSLFIPSYQNIPLAESGRADIDDALETFLKSGIDTKDKTIIVNLRDSLYSDSYYLHYVRYKLRRNDVTLIRSDAALDGMTHYYVIE